MMNEGVSRESGRLSAHFAIRPHLPRPHLFQSAAGDETLKLVGRRDLLIEEDHLQTLSAVS
jgi:hypothetical protein